MKKLRFSVVAVLAIVFATSSAFVTKLHAERASAKLTSYYWFNATSKSYHALNTTPDEQSLTGCMSATTDCEYGYNSNQLINPAQPSQGVKSGELPQSTIRKN